MLKKIKKTIENNKLLKKNEKIAVAISGGKDSMTVLYALSKLNYNVIALHVDLAMGEFSKKNIINMNKFCQELNIELKILSLKNYFNCSLKQMIKKLRKKGIKLNNCAICGMLKRHIMNKESRKLKVDKIVTGHNLDDEMESIMMNFFRNTLELSARIGPISGSVKDKKFIPRVKPLYFCKEANIRKFSKKNKFPVNYNVCPMRETSFRLNVLHYINKLEKKNKNVKDNIIKQFFKLQPKLKEKFKNNKEISYCKNCGEPARHDLCHLCEILGK